MYCLLQFLVLFLKLRDHFVDGLDQLMAQVLVLASAALGDDGSEILSMVLRKVVDDRVYGRALTRLQELGGDVHVMMVKLGASAYLRPWRVGLRRGTVGPVVRCSHLSGLLLFCLTKPNRAERFSPTRLGIKA